jgi:hypothetical protein
MLQPWYVSEIRVCCTTCWASAPNWINTNDLVMLDGSTSHDPDGDLPLTYQWVQTGGPDVFLSDPTAIGPSFVAPNTPVTLTFSLVFTDSLGMSALMIDEIVITIQPYHLYLPLVVRDNRSVYESVFR